MTQEQQQQKHLKDYSPYRTLCLDLGHAVVNTDLFERKQTILRDYRVLSWVFSEAPQLDVEPASHETVDFLAELYSGWYPVENDKELSLREATLNLPSFIQTRQFDTNRAVLEEFFGKYMEHYDNWAKEATDEELRSFRGATILKDVMYNHAFVHRPEHFGTHEAYQRTYAREFDTPELDDDVTWRTPLCTESEYELATNYLSPGDIAAVEDYVGAIIQLLDWSDHTPE